MMKFKKIMLLNCLVFFNCYQMQAKKAKNDLVKLKPKYRKLQENLIADWNNFNTAYASVQSTIDTAAAAAISTALEAIQQEEQNMLYELQPIEILPPNATADIVLPSNQSFKSFNIALKNSTTGKNDGWYNFAPSLVETMNTILNPPVDAGLIAEDILIMGAFDNKKQESVYVLVGKTTNKVIAAMRIIRPFAAESMVAIDKPDQIVFPYAIVGEKPSAGYLPLPMTNSLWITSGASTMSTSGIILKGAPSAYQMFTAFSIVLEGGGQNDEGFALTPLTDINTALQTEAGLDVSVMFDATTNLVTYTIVGQTTGNVILKVSRVSTAVTNPDTWYMYYSADNPTVAWTPQSGSQNMSQSSFIKLQNPA